MANRYPKHSGDWGSDGKYMKLLYPLMGINNDGQAKESQQAVTTTGHPSVGIGGGLGIDLETGDLTLRIGPGISVGL